METTAQITETLLHSETTTIPEYIITQNELLAEQNQLLSQLNVSVLFIIGAVAAVAVCVLLYKFLRLFY